MRIKLSIPIPIRFIAEALSVGVHLPDVMIEYVTTDSREVLKNDLYLSLSHDERLKTEYDSEAIKRGGFPITTNDRKGVIHIEDTDTALLSLSTLFLSRLPSLSERVAITGSVGKTTTKEFLAKILEKRYKIHYTYKNYNNSLGLLLSVLSAPSDTEIIILEIGSNKRGEIAALSRSIKPTLAAITKIGTSHIGNFGSEYELLSEKSDVLSAMPSPKLVCDSNIDIRTEGKTVKASTDASYADVFLCPVEETLTYTVFDLCLSGKLQDRLRLNVGGRHNLHCLAVAIALAYSLGCTLDDVRSGVSTISETDARHRIINVEDYYIFDDSYNSSIESVKADLELLKRSGAVVSSLLGDIYELGDKTEDIHRALGEAAHSSGVRNLYIFGEYAKYVYEGAISHGMSPDSVFLNEDTADPLTTAEQIRKNAKSGEIVLFKASHKLDLSRVRVLLQSERKDD